MSIRSASPLQRLITRENLRRYAKALACLTDRDRQLIVLRLMRGLSCLDVADRLGMRSEAAVHMAVRRALQRLEKSLKEVDSPSMSQGFDTRRLPQHSAPRLGASRSTLQGVGPAWGLRRESAHANVV